MTDTVKSYLTAINEMSRQLLSQLDTQLENNASEKNQQSIASNEESQLTDELLANIAAERQSLVTKMFETFTQEKLSFELPLVNDMVSLDEQLTLKAQLNKQAIAEQMVKLRKSKKVKKLYQKY
jgi:hypothetical protein